jgi:hypothetical protein
LANGRVILASAQGRVKERRNLAVSSNALAR